MPSPGTSSTEQPAIPQPRSKPSVRARFRYWFDNLISRRPSAIIAWLGAFTIFLVLIAALVVTLARLHGMDGGEQPLGFVESFWQNLLRILDPGTFSDDTHWPLRMVTLFVTIVGILIAGSLIGLIANMLDQKIDQLRKGRSDVLEEEHTLILGWSGRVPSIVSELIIANESEKRAVVVILAEHDKTEMEDTLRELIPDTKTTRIVCRNGEPWMAHNLMLANAHEAKSIIVTYDGTDSTAVKTLLAIRAVQKTDPTPAPIVAEVGSRGTGRSLEALLGSQLATICSEEIVAELTAQACRQRGLAGVFRELLDFDGDEVYFAEFPQLAGAPYRSAQLAFDRCSVMGIVQADQTVVLNPPPERPMQPGEKLIGVAEDDSMFVPQQPSAPLYALPADPNTALAGEQRIVIVGWSALGPRVLTEMDEFLDERTTVEVIVDPRLVNVEEIPAQVHVYQIRVRITELEGGPEIAAAHAAQTSFDKVILLGYRDALGVDDADARTMLTLLAFHNLAQQSGMSSRIVAELLDQRHAPLAEASGADDFIVSDQLTSLMLAQLSENIELRQVFADLFDREGCAVELRPAARYGAQHATAFGQVVFSASMQGHSAIGYRRAGDGEVIVNPPKSEPIQLTKDDEILVIASSDEPAATPSDIADSASGRP